MNWSDYRYNGISATCEDEVIAAESIRGMAWCFGNLWGLFVLFFILCIYVVIAVIRAFEACAYCKKVEKLPPRPYRIDRHLRPEDGEPKKRVRWRREYGPRYDPPAPSKIFATGTGERGVWYYGGGAK
ncbi:MAG: hypothetical protein H0Z39_07115 [Peptococcaceae bacterium]|nr:hypothetical protein [Peptococcaceae bacterium]